MSISTRNALSDVEAVPDSLMDRSAFIRLDYNENTDGLQGLCLSDLNAFALSSYPQYGTLLNGLADLFAVKPNQMMLSAGSDEAFLALCSVFIEPGRDTAVIANPTFGVIKQALVSAEAKIIEVPVRADMSFDLAALDEAVKTKPKLVILPTPDNPTGAVLPLDFVRQWSLQCPDTVFVIDEAYYEYCGVTALPLIDDRSNLLVLRTFSKAWGLAGLRVGVTIGSASLIALLKKVRLPFPVSSLSAELVLRALDMRELVERQADETMARKHALLPRLQERGLEFVAGGANFYLLKMGKDAAAFCDHLRLNKILVRNISRGESAEASVLYGCVRVGVGSEAENEMLLSAIDSFVIAGAAATPAS